MLAPCTRILAWFAMSIASPSLDALHVRALAPEIASLTQETDRSLKIKQQQHAVTKQSLPKRKSLSHIDVDANESPNATEGHGVTAGSINAGVVSISGVVVDEQQAERSACSQEDIVLSIESDTTIDADVVVHVAAGAATAPDGPADEVYPDPQSAVVPIAFPRIAIDRYGFLISDKRYNKGIPDATQKQRIWLENRRTHKWVKMIGKQLEDWEVCQLKNATKLKQRIRKGIPEALRGRVWCHLAGSTQMMHNNPGVFREFLQAKRVPCEETIARDIGRTFPKHYLFNDRSSMGQCALMNVLKAYSLHDPEVGYCQGMGFLSAMFLSYMPEEQSFWLLVACLNHKRYDMAGMYRPRMPKVPEVIYIFEQLLKQQLPQLAKHMDNEGMHPTMYLTQWFITLFTYNFPFEFVTRVWDVFLNEGWKVIFRVALALMKISQKALLAIKFEGIMEFFRELPTKVDTEEVLTVAFSLPLKRSQLNCLLEAYQKSISSTK